MHYFRLISIYKFIWLSFNNNIPFYVVHKTYSLHVKPCYNQQNHRTHHFLFPIQIVLPTLKLYIKSSNLILLSVPPLNKYSTNNSTLYSYTTSSTLLWLFHHLSWEILLALFPVQLTKYRPTMISVLHWISLQIWDFFL